MAGSESMNGQGSQFFLSKWFFDFTAETGEAMIFYSARLDYYRWKADYTCWLSYDPISGTSEISRFNNVPVPIVKDEVITFSDPVSGVSGIWKSMAPMVQSRIFQSGDGFVDWNCLQPLSSVKIKIHDRILTGRGYVEQTILTIPPWKISIRELKWGHFISEEFNIVWIELENREIQQWTWVNGERIHGCFISNDLIKIPEKDLELSLDMDVTLESEKKIMSVTKKIIRYIPVFKRTIPGEFLMADERKWFSKASLKIRDSILAKGMSIHEHVKFNSD
jgi:hypothetical protein